MSLISLSGFKSLMMHHLSAAAWKKAMSQKHKDRPKIEATCVSCGLGFLAVTSEVRRGKGKACSRACAASLASLGRDQSGEANNNWKGGSPTPYRLSKRLYRQRHPHKAAAHMAVRDAVSRGDLSPMPCEICFETHGVHAHHDDYSRPLDVVWLCKKHHEERHVELRAAGIGRYFKPE